MPRGEHPNSRANLKKGKKTQFCGESAVRAAKKKHENEIIYKSLNADLKEQCTPDRISRINARLISMAEHGNLRAYELVRDGLGEKPKESVGVAVEDPVVVINDAPEKPCG